MAYRPDALHISPWPSGPMPSTLARGLPARCLPHQPVGTPVTPGMLAVRGASGDDDSLIDGVTVERKEKHPAYIKKRCSEVGAVVISSNSVRLPSGEILSF